MSLPVVNDQPREKMDKQLTQDGMEVIDIWRTIQGEGPYVGHPAAFVRLAGCNLQCPKCDTNYTTGRRRSLIPHIVEDALAASFYMQKRICKLIVITGGEPFRQTNITKLVRSLISHGYTIQIETNGTFFLEDFPYNECTVVCSPKTSSIHSMLKTQNRIHSLKYILKHGEVCHLDGLPNSVLGNNCIVERPWKGFTGNVYVSPEDSGDAEQNKKNIETVKLSAMTYGYIAGVQLHKILGVD